jgi:tRNA-Thr(GGU) m(6)t(6)A37 methyltransferase TsaA
MTVIDFRNQFSMGSSIMSIEMKPIGFVSTDADDIPRSWEISDVEGTLVFDESYIEGLRDIDRGQHIYVIFQFHRSPKFNSQYLRINPPRHNRKEMGVFSTHSPVRPNPIGLSVLKVLKVEGNIIQVKGLDMVDGTPILDIKPEYHP